MKRNSVKKLFRSVGALCAAGVIALSVMTGSVVTADYEDDIDALQRKQEALAEERRQLEASLGEYEQNAEEHEKYLEIYDEKMKVQEQEIANIKEQISLLNDSIAELEEQIKGKEAEVAEGIEEFKARLRAMYMNGNDSIASMLAGSTDFYDILARTELMERMSRHDKEMIDDLNEKITALNNDKSALEQTKAETEQKKAEAESVLADLQKTYAEHEETKEWYEAQAEYSRNRTEEIKQEEADAEVELQEYIRKQQEELERKREEERKRREEEERKRREEEQRRKEEEERKRREEEEQKRLEAEAQGIEYVPEPEPEPEEDDSSEDTYQYVTGASQGFIWPCPTVLNITDRYGYRTIAEEGGSSDFHKGIDINKPGCAGEPIVASAAGTVIRASNTGNGYGIHVLIDHGDKISTLYGHMSSCCVNVGDEVAQGQTIGYIGCTGYAYGNHCHFEVRVNGETVDPLNYVSMG
ncbi:MAG: murein hydrolase activator EnvC family protein [Huintestinicola sp.]|uniref:murein hydrolase activator EnvC family protein n=1 Tax=Huintestinicola sp. TaxID=2981661 RepID=UPI003EFD5662